MTGRDGDSGGREAPRGRTGFGSAILAGVILLGLTAGASLLPGCGGKGHEAPARAPADSGAAAAGGAGADTSAFPPLLARRVGTSAVDRRMAELLGPQAFASDPHTFACKVCHSRFVQKSTQEWKNTCYQSGCHPRAWTRTVMHRLDPDIFLNCMNCHHPHTWRANAKDCLSCHGSILGPEGTVPATGVAGVATFSHAPHRDVPCARCHSSRTRHAELLITGAAQCRDCHHGPPAAASCATCHGSQTLEFTAQVKATLSLGVWSKPRARTLPFPHALHRNLECGSCHAPSPAETPKADCAGCHAAHHREGARCITCHRPPAKGAHDLAVHDDGCTDCHGPDSFKAMRRTRDFCLVCHQGQASHMEGKNCATCHKLAPVGSLASPPATDLHAAYRSGVPDTPFPHAAHQGLFPQCTACHAGIPAQDSTAIFSVTARDCARCHDGDVMPEIEWSEPRFPLANLRFDHKLHVQDNGIECATCHRTEGSENRMDVSLPKPEVCMNCHGSGPHTSAANDCATCHRPIAEVKAIPVSAIAAYPRPEDHAAADFIFDHGTAAGKGIERCAVCHARESCERCHRNSGAPEVIRKLASDPRFAGLETGKPGSWPKPPSHAADDWIKVHGKRARAGIQSCATCHTQPDCVRCHGGSVSEVIGRLPAKK